MQTIWTLKPNVMQEDAIECFCRTAIAARLHLFLAGPLRSVALFYIPFHLYQVEIQNRGTQQSQLMAIDAVSGTFDPYSFDQPFSDGQLIQVVTRNRSSIVISPEAGHSLITEKVRRAIFRTGFFRLQDFEVRSTFVPSELHIPYWLGFFGRGNSAHIEVLDAVRRRFEGARVKLFLRDWLRS